MNSRFRKFQKNVSVWSNFKAKQFFFKVLLMTTNLLNGERTLRLERSNMTYASSEKQKNLEMTRTNNFCLIFKIQGVHKVFRLLKKFIAKAVDEISYIDLFYINQCLLKFLVKLKFCVSD